MDECEQVATDGMRLPDPSTLRDAVKEVIRQNQEVGYNPGRFIQATQNGESKDLVLQSHIRRLGASSYAPGIAVVLNQSQGEMRR